MTNRFFFRSSFFALPAGAEGIVAGSVGTWVINRYLPIIASDVSLVHVRGRDISVTLGAWATFPFSSFSGTWPSVAMPANVTLQLRLKNTVRVQRQQPYVCLVAPPRDSIVGNFYTPAYRSAVVDAFSYLYESSGIDGTAWVWLSFRHDNAWRAEAEPHLVGFLRPNPAVAPRRRRLRNTVLQP